MIAQPGATPRVAPAVLTMIGLCLSALVWSYWTTLVEIVWRWAHDPQYSHGYLVPGFAAYLLWQRRAYLTEPLRSSAWGLALLAAALVFRLLGTRFHLGYFDQMSLLPCLLGLFLLAGGFRALAWAWPALAYLAFAIPLPHSWSLALSGPMQTFATIVSTFCLQTLGRPALAEGNLILLNDLELGIVEACSGLRMLVVFFALSTAVAMLIRKPLWEKLVIAASAVPIALVANVLRITITGLFYDSFGHNFGGALFHDIAGWLMMPLGLSLLGIELWILSHLLLEPVAKGVSATVTLQRVIVNPVTMYQSGGSRRERRAAADTTATP
jgi:exosortase